MPSNLDFLVNFVPVTDEQLVQVFQGIPVEASNTIALRVDSELLLLFGFLKWEPFQT